MVDIESLKSNKQSKSENKIPESIVTLSGYVAARPYMRH